MAPDFWDKRVVLVTGHTGFKGGWLCLWLKKMGAQVVGYSLPPHTSPSLFEQIDLASQLVSIMGDVRDLAALTKAIQTYQPSVVFHLAAQSLVKYSYQYPIETYSTNLMGTANLLEAVRQTHSVSACQVITTDKCYENEESEKAYIEEDRLGGRDPYSSSKACAELIVASYRDSFFAEENKACLATVRAGNVIGGGDWCQDRIIPDCIRALTANQPIKIRHPMAIRPWQYVLEPLAGYLWLAEKQVTAGKKFAGAWNFGPTAESTVSVRDLVEQTINVWGQGVWQEFNSPNQTVHEARILKLNSDKASRLLGWRAIYPISKAIEQTVSWYKNAQLIHASAARALCLKQIDEYINTAQQAGLAWATH